MTITKKNQDFLNRFLITIWGISNKEYQKRVWIEASGPEVDDFDETCIYFGDIDIILNNPSDYALTQRQCNILQKFKYDFDDFADKHSWPASFINFPQWTSITEKAKAILEVFNYKPPSL